MSGWTGSWLPGSDGGPLADRPQQQWRGERLGLPESGAGAVASVGRRAAALVIDVVLAGGVASVFTYPELARNWSLLAWFVITIVAVSFFGFTPGMAVLGIRVARLDGARMVGLLRGVPRAALVFLIIPAVIWDADGRGVHDKLLGTVVVHIR